MSYIHHIPGRIRVRTAGTKRDAHRSRVLELCLRSLDGVEYATVNPLTGNALIYYRPGTIDGGSLIEQMRERQWIATPAERRSQPANPIWLAGVDRAELRHVLARKLVEVLAQAAIERCLTAVIAAVL